MVTKEFLQYTGFCAPIISSLGCAIMLVLFRHTHAKSEEGTLHRLLVSYFLLVSLGWICSLVYVYLPLLYVRINVLFYLIVFWSQVVFYQFIYTLTRLPGEKPFSRIHYIFPLVIVGTFAVWSAFVPFETQVYIVTSAGRSCARYEAYSRFSPPPRYEEYGTSLHPPCLVGDCWLTAVYIRLFLPMPTALRWLG